MAKKKRQDRFNPVKEIKAMARERIGNPPTSRVVPDRKKKKKESEKYKFTLAKMLEQK